MTLLRLHFKSIFREHRFDVKNLVNNRTVAVLRMQYSLLATAPVKQMDWSPKKTCAWLLLLLSKHSGKSVSLANYTISQTC